MRRNGSQFNSVNSHYNVETSPRASIKVTEKKKGMKKPGLKVSIKSLSKGDLVDILQETSKSFRNVSIPRELFEQIIEQNIGQFKNQLERVIMNSQEDREHKHEIERIYYEIQKNQDTFELNKVSFYYFFKMNSLFAHWGVFDYSTFQKRCKHIMD